MSGKDYRNSGTYGAQAIALPLGSPLMPLHDSPTGISVTYPPGYRGSVLGNIYRTVADLMEPYVCMFAGRNKQGGGTGEAKRRRQAQTKKDKKRSKPGWVPRGATTNVRRRSKRNRNNK